MKRAHRLGRSRELTLLLERGRRLSSPFFRVVFGRNNLNHSRFAFIIPRTADKRAVVRNRLRRRMREWVRTRAAPLPPLDIAITCTKEAASATRSKFYGKFEEILVRISKQ